MASHIEHMARAVDPTAGFRTWLRSADAPADAAELLRIIDTDAGRKAVKALAKQVVEDAGEYLPGARKHLWTPGANITVTDLEVIEAQPEGTIYKYLTKAHVLGPFPWEAERDADVTPAAAVLKEKIWHSVAQRPGNHLESRRLYVKGADWLKEQFEKLKTAEDVYDFVDRWKVYVAGYDTTEPLTAHQVAERLRLPVPHRPPEGERWSSRHTLDLSPPDVYERAAELLRMSYKTNEHSTEDRIRFRREADAMKAPFQVEFTNRDLQAAGYTDVLRTQYRDPEGRQNLIRLLTDQPEYKEGRNNPKGYLFALAGFDNESELRTMKKQQLAVLVGKGGYGFSDVVRASARKATWEELLKESPGRAKVSAWVRATTDQRRVGPPLGAPATLYSDEFVREFGFKGDQFGESVTQGERVLHRSHAWGAFADLARILDLPYRAMGNCGILGIAFGARGKGRASAHYESINAVTLQYLPVINLTNTRGDGSLAHEWGHFLDHHLSSTPSRVFETQDGLTVMFASGGRGGAKKDVWSGSSSDPKVAGAMANVVLAMNVPDEETRAALQAERKRILNAANTEMGRLNGEYRAKRIDRASYEQGWNEAKRMAKEAPDASMTRYRNDAETLGDYWVRPTEMFARAFESWVEDELTARGEENTYLVFGTQKPYGHHVQRQGVQVGPLEPYPQGREREKINAAMRTLMAAVRASNVLCRESGAAVQESVPATELTAAQVKALRDFEQPGGHGYGEFAYLPRPTAESLERLGLVLLSYKRFPGGRSHPWGEITDAGRAALKQIEAKARAGA